MTKTLLILAAGMGSRYGGLKQIDPMGPNGETLLDYSVQDALSAGFSKVVFVIRRCFAEDFERIVCSKYRENFEVACASQELDDLPKGFELPGHREKPWGTAHAVYAARHLISDPFLVINADDYYGKDSYASVSPFLSRCGSTEPGSMAMVGFPILNTLSPNGSVNRGVCRIGEDYLSGIEEHTKISRTSDGRILGTNLSGSEVEIPMDSLVSMNFWAFSPAIFSLMEQHFADFLEKNLDTPRSEWAIPTLVDDLIDNGIAKCEVRSTTSEWFGVTYPEDKPLVQERLRVLRG